MRDVKARAVAGMRVNRRTIVKFDDGATTTVKACAGFRAHFVTRFDVRTHVPEGTCYKVDVAPCPRATSDYIAWLCRQAGGTVTATDTGFWLSGLKPSQAEALAKALLTPAKGVCRFATMRKAVVARDHIRGRIAPMGRAKAAQYHWCGERYGAQVAQPDHH